jgi:hypothetical protein
MGRLIELLRPEYMPVAIYHLDEKPDYAEDPAERGCIVGNLLLPALEGKTLAAKRDKIGCRGAWNGLGLGGEDPEGRAALSNYYSTGKGDHPGKHYFCSPEMAMSNHQDRVPLYGTGEECVVFQPLDRAEEMGAPIETVVFLVDGLEYSAMVTLAGFSRKVGDSVVRSSFGLSCEQMYAMPRQEGESDTPRMVLGMTEIFTRRFVSPGRMALSMPYSLYKKLDEDSPSSFLKDDAWRAAATPKCKDCH